MIMSIYNVSKADMIAWFKRNNQVDSILTFARLREMQRAMPESDRLIRSPLALRAEHSGGGGCSPPLNRKEAAPFAAPQARSRR